MRRYLFAALPVVASLCIATSSAQAVVVDMSSLGQSNVSYNSSNRSGYYGVALLPGTRSSLASTSPSIPTVSSGTPCSDPALTSDLAFLPSSSPLCWHGGPIVGASETFAVTWDPDRSYWDGTKGFLEQFLRDVADGSGTFTSPYALTTQYTDGSGRAQNSSKYGGGCTDYGNPNNTSNTNTTCLFGSSIQTGPGYNYPSNGCVPSGSSFTYSPTLSSNTVCLTDAQLQGELQNVVPQTGMLNHVQPGYTPLVVMLLPPQVETCLNAAGTLCSANSAAGAKFCSYHGQVNIGGTEVAYVVQPWSALTTCDEPDVPQIKQGISPADLAKNVGYRLASPISQAEIAALVNPGMNGWFALNGAEINDNNGCVPEGSGADTVTVGNSSQNPYYLQREFDNAAAITNDPNTYFGCAPDVILSPSFVVPSAIDQGENVVFDGSSTAATLLVPNANYQWDFGDGTAATGPSVVHSYATGGTYTVKLTVTDRGNNQVSVTQPVNVLGPDGLPVPTTTGNAPTSAGAATTSGATNSGGGTAPGSLSRLSVRLLLMPQGLRLALQSGIAIHVSSNQPVGGFAYVFIPKSAAKRAGIRAGRGTTVRIGRGTVGRIHSGTSALRLHLSRSIVSKLLRLKHVTLTVSFSLVSSSGERVNAVAAAHY